MHVVWDCYPAGYDITNFSFAMFCFFFCLHNSTGSHIESHHRHQQNCQLLCTRTTEVDAQCYNVICCFRQKRDGQICWHFHSWSTSSSWKLNWIMTNYVLNLEQRVHLRFSGTYELGVPCWQNQQNSEVSFIFRCMYFGHMLSEVAVWNAPEAMFTI